LLLVRDILNGLSTLTVIFSPAARRLQLYGPREASSCRWINVPELLGERRIPLGDVLLNPAQVHLKLSVSV
jgi:hypothetical protein